MDRRTKLGIGGAAAVVVIGAGVVPRHRRGDRRGRRPAAAGATRRPRDRGGAREHRRRPVLETEAGDDGAAYSVEVRTADGTVGGGAAGRRLPVTGSAADDDGSGGDGRRLADEPGRRGRARDRGRADHVYVTGHRNPDLDSIASAIGYAELKGRLDAERAVRRRAAGRGERADALGARAQRRSRAGAPAPRPPAGARRHAPGVPARRPGRLAPRRGAGDGGRRRRPRRHRRRGGRGRRDDHRAQPRPPLHQGVGRAVELRRPAGVARPDRRRARRARCCCAPSGA